MASVLDQLPNSQYSLQGNNFNPQPNTADWGYSDFTYNGGDISPELSDLHWDYSTIGDPSDIKIVDYNRQALGGVTAVRPPSGLDELDSNAPTNYQAGTGGVVSQIYKSSTNQTYRDKGPSDGRY